MFKRIRQWFSSEYDDPGVKPPAQDLVSRSAALQAQGNRCLDQGNLLQAEQCYRQALAGDPDNAERWVNLGFVQIEMGRLSEASASLMQAIARDTNNCDSHYLLGTVLENMGELPQAAQEYRAALSLKPAFDICCRDLVRVLFHLGHLDEAQSTLSRGLELHADLADLHLYKGHMAMAQGHAIAAVKSYEQAVKLAPGQPGLHAALGQAHEKLGHWSLASASFQAARTLEPNNPEHLKGLADILQKQGRSELALDLYRQGLTLAPNHAGLLANMSLAMRSLGLLEEARAACERAISLAPQMIAAHNNLGITLTQMGKLPQAIVCLQQAIEHEPGFAPAHSNLGVALQKLGRLEPAIRCYRDALALDPGYLEAHSNLLFALSFIEDLSAAAFLAEAQAFGASVQRLVSGTSPSTAPRTQGQKLKVGLVSGDFHEHPVGFFLENMLRHLDHGRIDLIAYATQVREDALTRRIRPSFTQWRDIAGLGDAEAATLVRQDAIDILVDLAGHTANNRLALFAWRPAPLAVSWLGWWASTGLREMDYVLSDPVSLPEAYHSHFSEKVWYLPQTRFCFTPPDTKAALDVTHLPALQAGYITFACFQQISKISDQVLALWSRIAAALPHARFRVQNASFDTHSGCDSFRTRLHAAGLNAESFTLHPASSREAYLKAYQSVDLVLDTFPFNGATTTCEALWMGVPTITLAGERLVARQGASLMSGAGLGDWVASSQDDYVGLAIEKARDLEALNRLRLGLRAAVLASPVFDARLFANQWMQALEGMRASMLETSVRAATEG